jgi:hypothetical protein
MLALGDVSTFGAFYGSKTPIFHYIGGGDFL